jgi:hypothetical protein
MATLFPPVTQTFAPAFVRTAPCKLYFSLPVYNSSEEIKYVQVSVKYQNNNLSALNTSSYPTGIMVTNLNVDNSIEDDNNCYVVINPSDLESGIFELNQYYKVQLRFVSKDASTLPTSPKISYWLSENQSYFSEWSSVCLIRGIQKPTFEIKGLIPGESKEDIVFTNEVFDFVGRMYYAENNDIEKETLKQYQLKIYDLENPLELYGDSGIVYTDAYSPNEINYTLEKELKDGSSYKVVCTYTTENNYTETLNYYFSILLYSLDSMNIIVTAEADNENGRVKVNVQSKEGESYFGNLTIRRASSDSNFTVWNDIYTTLISSDGALNFNWYDITVENGVWYQYAVQKRNVRGDRGIITKAENLVVPYAEDIFLTDGIRQLKIKYDPNISTYKQTVTESKTDTLGGVYPYIRRNGNTNYKQFSISGLISCYSDEDSLMTTEEELFGTALSSYQSFNETNFIKQRDFIKEKKFRDKVMNFLYNGEPKLYKSLTEGNVLVKLMDISFTPNQTLGRMVYSFSCTAYEIAAPTQDNYIEYGIQESGSLGSYTEYTTKKLGQLYNTDFEDNEDVLQAIKDFYKERASSNYSFSLKGLTSLKIEINTANTLPKLWIPNTSNSKYVVTDSAVKNKTHYGYAIMVNGEQILIDDSGIYELYDDNLIISSLSFCSSVTATINYTCELDQKEVVEEVASKYYYNHINGQLWGSFEPKELQLETLMEKYRLNSDTSYQKFVSINTMTIEANPGTIVYIKDSLDDSYNRFVIGESGTLNFGKSDRTISDFYFAGTHLIPNTTGRTKGIKGEYYEQTSPKYGELDKIPNPVNGTAYWAETGEGGYMQRWYYWDGEFILFNSATDDLLEPVDAVVSYYCDVMRGEY